MSSLLNKFLEARTLIDRSPPMKSEHPQKEERNIMDKPSVCTDSVRELIDSKPTKKAVMEFLKRKVAQYTDTSSEED